MWRFLERSLSSIAPTWGFNRAVARYNLTQVPDTYVRGSARASKDINDQAARVAAAKVGTVDEDVDENRERDLATARHLYAKNSWAVGAINSITGNVIGRGMKPESEIVIQSRASKGQPATAQNDQVEAAFTTWARGADLSGKKSFQSLQRQIYRERWIAGEVFVRRHLIEDRFIQRKKIGLALEVVPGEMLSDLTQDNIKQGIELDKNNAPIAYHFLKSEGSFEDPIRVDAEDVIHIFKPHRPGALRGLSPMAVVANSFEALRRYLNHELTRAAISSAFVALHKTGGKGIRGLATGNAADRTDASGNTLLQILDGGGMLLEGGPQDSLESVSPAIQSTAFDPFVQLVLRSIATGLGISYELMARDFRRTNFSSARQSNLEDRRQWEPEQQEFTDEFLLKVWDWFIDAAKLAGITPFTSSRAEWPVSWTPQGWLWIDPVKEAMALEKAIQIGVDNPIDAARRQGRDYHENIRKIAAAQAYAKEQGATLGEPKEETPDVDDEDEEEETSASEDAPESGSGPTAAEA